MSDNVMIKVIDSDGNSGEELSLDGRVFNREVKAGVLHQVVVWQLAKRRQGTHKAKTRAEVNLSRKKPWKQKGTGRARAGTRTSPLWVGGGQAHGPSPRDYTSSVPKKVRQLALKGALSSKAKAEQLMVVDGFSGVNGKTSEMASILKKLGLYQEQVLIVSATKNEALVRATRNIPGAVVLPVEGLNVYDLLRSRRVVMEKDCVAAVERRLGLAEGEEASNE